MRFLMALFLVVTTNASAQSVRGIGAKTCAEFIQTLKDEPDSKELDYFYWAQGFMSGVNFARGEIKNPMVDLTSKRTSDQLAYIRFYCEHKPSGVYMEAVLSLFTSMLSSQSN